MHRNTLSFVTRLFVALVILSLAFPAVAFGQVGDPPTPEPADADAPKEPSIAYHAETGKVRFMAAEAGKPLAQAPGFANGFSAADTPELAARYFLGTYAAQFGIQDPQHELTLERASPLESGATAVRFQQVYQGVPILGGELIVQVNAAGQTLAAMGEALPDLNLSVEPAVPAAEAAETARLVVAKAQGFDAALAVASEPALWIYNPALLGGPGLRENRLVWRVEVTSSERLDVRELALVDAQTGAAPLHFNQIHTALNRKIYTKDNEVSSTLPGTLVRSEGGAASGVEDVDNAYDYAGATYNFYLNTHKRDSIDGKGMSLIQTVKYCDPSEDCPYANAFWNGEQMVYGDGYASGDDVVAHELTHGVTEHESGLFYWTQSGAINEALSDIWGELIDLSYTNGRDDDIPAKRWLMGEDLPIGAIRSMSNPPAFQQPDSTNSLYYTCDLYDGDSGGVHTNSGVANKAAYLMVDGDTFNGYTISGIGIQKTARIFYAAQTGALTTGSDYLDLNDALAFACSAQIGMNGITASDCNSVRKALRAVRMDQPVSCAHVSNAPVCDAVAFSQPNASLTGWNTINGSWVSNGFSVSVNGINNNYVSMSRPSVYSDFTFAATLTRQGCQDCAAGLLVRGQDTPLPAQGNRWSEAYFFAYNNNMQYKVEHWTPTGVVTLQPWTTREKDFYAPYDLKVVSESSKLSFFIDGALLWTGYDLGMRSADVGIALQSDNSPNNALGASAISLKGGTPMGLLADGFEFGMGGWTSTDLINNDSYSDAWIFEPWGMAASEAKAMHALDWERVSDVALAMNNPVTLPASGSAFIRFNHYYALEEDYDGGALEYSANNGAWTDAGGLFVNQGYPSTISSVDGSPIAGRDAFTGTTYGFTTSRADLNPLLGKNVRFRFRFATDESVGVHGWTIDDVQIYACSEANYTRFIRLPLVIR